MVKRVRMTREESNHVEVAGDAMFNQMKYGGRHVRASAYGLPKGNTHRQFVELLFNYPTKAEMKSAFAKAKVVWPESRGLTELEWGDWMRTFKARAIQVVHNLSPSEEPNV